MKIKALLLLVLSFLSVASYGESIEKQDVREFEYLCSDKCYEGRIGKAGVMVMFVLSDSTPVGTYYYGSNMANLILKPDESVANLWKEFDESGKLTGLLTIVLSEAAATGTWTSPDGKTHVPVDLKASLQGYSSRRLKALKTFVMDSKTIGAHAYQTFTIPGLGPSNGVRLSGNSPGIRQINQSLYEEFSISASTLLDCRAKGLAIGNESYETSFEVNVVAWNGSFVVVRSQDDGYCGQAHPYSDNRHITYSTLNGQKEDTALWLVEEYREHIPLSSGLGKLLSRAYIREHSKSAPEEVQECLKASSFSGSDMVPSAGGIVFTNSVPYASTPCQETFTTTYQMMQPFLSLLGKRNSLFFKMDGRGVLR